MRLIRILIMAMITSPVIAGDEFGRLAPDFQPNYTPAISDTEGGLWHYVNEAEEAIKHSPNTIKDPELNAYVKSVVCKLSGEYCNGIRVYIVRKPYFNASMAPNGMMQVWSGLLVRMRNEAQLATVLGHEIGHYLRRHSLKNFENVKTKSTLFTFFTLGIAGVAATGNIDPNIGRSVTEATHLGVLASIFAYNRDSEREADQFGIQLLHDSGLNVHEAAKIWQNLLDEEDAANDTKSRPIFFTTHPDPGERIENLKTYATSLSLNKKSTANPSTYSEAYWNNIEPFMGIFLQDEVNLNNFEKTQFLLNNLIKDQILPGTVYFYLGELYRKRNDEGDIASAQQYYERSLKSDDYPPETHRSLGLLQYKEKKRDVAKENFEKYLMLVPDANDKEMIEFYINFGG